MGTSEEQQRRRLPIDLTELDLAFQSWPEGIEYYLDVQTGEVVGLTEDIRSAFQSVQENLDDDADGTIIDFEAELTRRDLPEWMQEAVEQAAAVESGFGTRYLPVPSDDSGESYRDMEKFVEQIQDQRLQELLDIDMLGRGAFRRFKDTLEQHPREREAWFGFRDTRVRMRVLDWLDSEGIEPIAN